MPGRRFGRWVLPFPIPRRFCRLTRAKLWDVYTRFNLYKVWINYLRCRVSATRWERGYYEYLRDSWSDLSEALNFAAAYATYSATLPYCCLEYIGQTMITLARRLRTHVTAALGAGGAQAVHRSLRRLNVHRVIWTPTRMWAGVVTRRVRLAAESEQIWDRNAMLNRVGTPGARDGTDAQDGHVVFGRRRRFRLVIRLRKLPEHCKPLITG